MQLGWIDFSKEDRQKALDVINLLSEQGAVDELGIGIIRDAFVNYFFPGTSTIQTRAKYFLIVPYALREAVDGRYGKDANRILRAIDSAEKDCGISMERYLNKKVRRSSHKNHMKGCTISGGHRFCTDRSGSGDPRKRTEEDVCFAQVLRKTHTDGKVKRRCLEWDYLRKR